MCPATIKAAGRHAQPTAIPHPRVLAPRPGFPDLWPCCHAATNAYIAAYVLAFICAVLFFCMGVAMISNRKSFGGERREQQATGSLAHRVGAAGRGLRLRAACSLNVQSIYPGLAAERSLLGPRPHVPASMGRPPRLPALSPLIATPALAPSPRSDCRRAGPVGPPAHCRQPQQQRSARGRLPCAARAALPRPGHPDGRVAVYAGHPDRRLDHHSLMAPAAGVAPGMKPVGWLRPQLQQGCVKRAPLH